jgi:hypothetical protein
MVLTFPSTKAEDYDWLKLALHNHLNINIHSKLSKDMNGQVANKIPTTNKQLTSTSDMSSDLAL